jgi:hypothetical protein
MDGSSGVLTSIGEIIAQGYFSSIEGIAPGPQLISLTTQSGLPIASATIGPAPNPLPSPLATPAGVSGAPYAGIPIPMLAPETTYEVGFTHNTKSTQPPCLAPETVNLGSFTTK